MAEILGLGLTHYPPLCGDDSRMAGILRATLEDPAIPPAEKDPANWPQAMRAEWADDFGAASAALHRARLVTGFGHVRAALEAFAPDVVLIWGDDQYENFREDVVPAFTVCAYDDLSLFPWRDAQGSSMMAGGKPNVWQEGPDTEYRLKGARVIAKQLASGLLDAGIDVAYAYRPLHHPSLAHAFTNAVLYLDYDRKLGWNWPTIAFPINCYGRRVISARGFMTRFADPLDFDPPSPSPARCMQMGRAVARVLRASPWRVALVASSSWSHAFLVDHTWRLRPDTVEDRRLYAALTAADYKSWQQTPLAAIEHAGQQEMLNWFALLGAMQELQAPLLWSEFVETHVFNSNKVFAVYDVR